jgi:hypothetical protein
VRVKGAADGAVSAAKPTPGQRARQSVAGATNDFHVLFACIVAASYQSGAP